MVPLRLIEYTSKAQPPVAANYPKHELELLDSHVNICQFKHLTAKVDFNCPLNHLAFTNIMKIETEPASQCSTFPALHLLASRENYLLIHIKQMRNVLGKW